MMLRESILVRLFFAFLFVFPTTLLAQETLSVTVTPPLFQLSIGPGETWASVVKVVNNNAYDVSYRAHVVDFEQDGESGQSSFVPLVESFADEPRSAHSLGSWIELSKEPFLVASGKSADVQFTVHVPENADPGGHYAAILIGPASDTDGEQGSFMRVSSLVTSLLFVKIKGEVVERGRIREFTSEKTLYQVPVADFGLRFENMGNTHLRPTGIITIYNMWGKKRGEVLINEKSGFGNVLPRSIRKFEFSWEGERNPFEVGRYSAEVTLSYGDDEKQNTIARTYFWIVPIVPVVLILGTIAFIIISIMWLVRRYIRRALELERLYHARSSGSSPLPSSFSTIQALVRPLREGVVDLRNARNHQSELQNINSTHPEGNAMNRSEFIRKYSLFFIFIGLVLCLCLIAWFFFATVLISERGYTISEQVASSTTQ
jgi:hypothetical protein